MLSTCPVNVQLLKEVALKLKEVQTLTQAQSEAVRDGNAEAIEDLHVKIQAAYKAKERSVEAWTRHHREHGC